MKSLKIVVSILLMMLLVCTAAVAEGEDRYVPDGEEFVVFDTNDIKLYFTGKHLEASGTILLEAVVENNTDQLIRLLYTGTANGWSLPNGYADDIQANSKKNTNIWFDTSDTKAKNFSEIETANLIFSVYNEAFENLFEIETGTLHFHETEDSVHQEENVQQGREETIDAAALETDKKTDADEKEYELLQIGSKGEAVTKLQKYLKALGFLSGSADGDYGKMTAAAVSAFQKSEGLEETGIADSHMQNLLFTKELPEKTNICISSGKLGENSIGTPQAYVRFTNEGDVSIDRVDFDIRCYDTYGDLIKGYGYYDYTECFYDKTIKPGKTSDTSWRWDLYGFDGTDVFEAAIFKYHMTDGTTVEIPQDKMIWYKVD